MKMNIKLRAIKFKKIMTTGLALIMSLGTIFVVPNGAYAQTNINVPVFNNNLPPNTTGYIQVAIDGVLINFPDQHPILKDGRTLVPARGVFEHLGFEVYWWYQTQSVSLVMPNPDGGSALRHLIITMGQSYFTDGKNPISLDVPAQLIGGRTMLPLRAISETVGAYVQWDEDNQRVIMTVNGNDANIQQPTTPFENENISNINSIPSQTNQPQTGEEWLATLHASSINLPNRRLTDIERKEWIDDYWANGGHNAFELEVVRLVNEVRIQHGLQEVQICPVLMKASRFYLQQVINQGLILSGHRMSPYGGSFEIVGVFGSSVSAVNAIPGALTPQEPIDSWMNSEGHRRNLLNPNIRYVGVGAFCTGTNNVGNTTGASVYLMAR